uniref:Uncharacterized protein n=1 Tax=Cacopsylla melanoneura TaxID=428564 RepID=A0A8D8ZC52_9HEMI
MNAMLYAPRKLRGLGVINFSWELYLQHFSIASKLINVEDGLLHISFDCEAEIKLCLDKLQVDGSNSRELRSELRMKAFEEWSRGKYQGIGVIHFADQQTNSLHTKMHCRHQNGQQPQSS